MSAKAFIRSPTRQVDFRHLAIKNKGSSSRGGRVSAVFTAQQNNHFVHPDDRVRRFNLEPGDQVLVRSGFYKGQLGRIKEINRSTNQVYCEDLNTMTKAAASREKGTVFNKRGSGTQLLVISKPIHYSNLALVLPQSSTSAATEETKLVATRLKTKRMIFSTSRRAFNWIRQPERVRALRLRMEDNKYYPVPEDEQGQAMTAIPLNSLASKALREGKRRDQSADYAALWQSQLKDKRIVYPNGIDNQTQLSVLQNQTFKPLLNPIPSRNLPETTLRYSEYGNFFSRARKTDTYNSRHRDALTWKLQKMAPLNNGRRLARIKWDKNVKRADLPLSSTLNALKV